MKVFQKAVSMLLKNKIRSQKVKKNHPFEPVDPVPENQPFPCEDRIIKVAQLPVDTFVKRAVLASHCHFRNSIKISVAAFGIIPLGTYALTDFLAANAARFDIGPFSDFAVIVTFGFIISISALLILFMTIRHNVDRRFTLIRRQYDFAVEAISVEDVAHISNAVVTLEKTWTYRIFLMRWLRDVRDVIIATAIVCALLGLLIISNYPALINLATPAKWATWAAIALVDCVMLISLTNHLIKIASQCPLFSSIAPVTERILYLLDEVTELRRGVRVA